MGWDYIWFQYEQAVDDGALYLKPKFYFIERIYDRDDFDNLGIEEPYDTPFGL